MRLVIPGTRALSPFRLQKLAADIDAAGLDAEVRDTCFLHLVDTVDQLDEEDTGLLIALLRYGASTDQATS